MKKLLSATFVLLAATILGAQQPPSSDAAKPTPTSTAAAQPAKAQSCLIVKHKGTVGRRLMFTALIGVPIAPGAKYDYVDSVNVQGTKMSYKGKELEQLQSTGVHVSVLQNKYTPADLESARKSCQESPAAPVTK